MSEATEGVHPHLTNRFSRHSSINTGPECNTRMTDNLQEDFITFVTISRSIVLKARKSKQTLYSRMSFLHYTVYDIMWKNLEALDRPLMTI